MIVVDECFSSLWNPFSFFSPQYSLTEKRKDSPAEYKDHIVLCYVMATSEQTKLPWLLNLSKTEPEYRRELICKTHFYYSTM